jgi:hypothetical protein
LVLPAVARANPLLPVYITEVLPDSGAPRIIELYIVFDDYETLNGFSIETSQGIFRMKNGIVVSSGQLKDLGPEDFRRTPVFLVEADYVILRDSLSTLAMMTYGEDDSDIEAPSPGQSLCARIGYDPYGGYYDLLFWYRDSSPTFGAWNDSLGAMGTITGTVTDKSTGLPIAGVSVTCWEPFLFASSNSEGIYTLRTYATPSTLEFVAGGYETRSSPERGVRIDPDSATVYDVQLTPVDGVESSGPGENTLPRDFSLAQNFPNPFNPRTLISFTIPEFSRDAMKVALRIHDARGRTVRTLIDEYRNAGKYTAWWDGKDDRGTDVGSGVFFYTLQAEDFTSTRKMLITR